VLDTNVLVAALLSSRGAPADLLRLWLGGGFEMVVSPLLLQELQRVLAYPKIRSRVGEPDAEAFVAFLREQATVVEDEGRAPPQRAADPDDDFVIALAESTRAMIVSGDRHLLSMAGSLPVQSPADFLRFLRLREGE
jgi:putative PIN family toxin of toxin-antitoxin system